MLVQGFHYPFPVARLCGEERIRLSRDCGALESGHLTWRSPLGACTIIALAPRTARAGRRERGGTVTRHAQIRSMIPKSGNRFSDKIMLG
jgi:hypothetical protein